MSAVLEPTVTTPVPGPVSQANADKLNSVFDARAVHFVVDYTRSSGT